MRQHGRDIGGSLRRAGLMGSTPVQFDTSQTDYGGQQARVFCQLYISVSLLVTRLSLLLLSALQASGYLRDRFQLDGME